MEEEGDLRVKIFIGIVIVLIACAFIPYSHWDTSIVSGRLVSEGTIVECDDGMIVVRLYDMSETDDMVETGTLITLEGNVPDDARRGQSVRIGYSDSDGLYANPDQAVQTSYYVDDNLLMGFIVDRLIPFQSTKTDLRIVGIQSDGLPLAYNVAA